MSFTKSRISSTILLKIHNFYIPAGGDIPDTKLNEKFNHKINFIEELKGKIFSHQQKKTVILGDFNIAPENQDVYDPDAWEEKILCSKKERLALKNILDLGFSDSFRLFPQKEELYSWWDYRTGAFRRNRGLRIDLVLTNNALSKKCKSSYIDTNPRKNERPSDHAPVISTFDI